MIDPASQDVLQEVLRRESRSLLAYTGDAYPWTTAAGGADLDFLRQLIRQEAEAVASLGRFLVRNKVPPPYIGPYPMEFTTHNFVALGFLVPRLLEAQKQSMAQLKADLARLRDPASRQEVERLLGVKKKTLAGLEQLAAVSPASASV